MTAQDRVDEFAAAVVSGHPYHLLRRRNRHGDNIYLGDRNACARRCNWTPDRNGRLLRADPARLYAPTSWIRSTAMSRSMSKPSRAACLRVAQCNQATDLGAKVDACVRPRHHGVHPPGQPLGARLCQAAWRRGDPLRRQPVAIRASHRTRSFGLEGSHSAGNARPHAFPADRELPYMITLAPYGFYWFSASRARQIGTCRTDRRSRVSRLSSCR